MDRLEELLKSIDALNKERDWDQFHTPVNLAKSVAIESGELLECFQWDEKGFDKSEVEGELADVLSYCLQLCAVLDLDPIEVVRKKMEETAKKYPVEKAKGVATKYTKL